MSTTTGITPADNQPWASMLDKDDPTLLDLATGADELPFQMNADHGGQS